MLDLANFPPLIDPDGAIMRETQLIPDQSLTATNDLKNVISPWAAMVAEPHQGAETTTSLLHGEAFMALGSKGEWTYGQALYDGYVGWVPSVNLAEATQPNAIVSALLTNIYSAADIKSAPMLPLPMGALVTVDFDTVGNGFVALETGGFVTSSHVAPLPIAERDHLAVATEFLDCPYLWGGRTMGGIDCSGLVQISLMMAGLRCHRDSDLQCASLGIEVERDAMEDGDLVFFPGHVGIAVDDQMILHANATHMKVTVDPLDDVISRVEQDLAKKGKDLPALTAVKRLP